MSLCIRSSPKRMPNSSRSRRYASAWRRFIAVDNRQSTVDSPSFRQLLQLLAKALELVALRLDHCGRRLLHEALVGQLALGALDLRLERDAPLCPAPLGALHVDRLRRQDLDGPARYRDRRDRVAV